MSDTNENIPDKEVPEGADEKPGRKRDYQRQSARMVYLNKDHRELIYDGNYINAIYFKKPDEVDEESGKTIQYDPELYWRKFKKASILYIQLLKYKIGRYISEDNTLINLDCVNKHVHTPGFYGMTLSTYSIGRAETGLLDKLLVIPALGVSDNGYDWYTIIGDIRNTEAYPDVDFWMRPTNQIMDNYMCFFASYDNSVEFFIYEIEKDDDFVAVESDRTKSIGECYYWKVYAYQKLSIGGDSAEPYYRSPYGFFVKRQNITIEYDEKGMSYRKYTLTLYDYRLIGKSLFALKVRTETYNYYNSTNNTRYSSSLYCNGSAGIGTFKFPNEENHYVCWYNYVYSSTQARECKVALMVSQDGGYSWSEKVLVKETSTSSTQPYLAVYRFNSLFYIYAAYFVGTSGKNTMWYFKVWKSADLNTFTPVALPDYVDIYSGQVTGFIGNTDFDYIRLYFKYDYDTTKVPDNVKAEPVVYSFYWTNLQSSPLYLNDGRWNENESSYLMLIGYNTLCRIILDNPEFKESEGNFCYKDYDGVFSEDDPGEEPEEVNINDYVYGGENNVIPESIH